MFCFSEEMNFVWERDVLFWVVDGLIEVAEAFGIAGEVFFSGDENFV